MIEANQVIKFY